MQLSINKVAAGVVGLAMVAGLAFAFTATRAHAITLSELVELFIALEVIPEDKADEARAVLDNQDETSTDGATMSCNFTRSLTQGDTGADVEDLQKLLNLKGFTVSASGAGAPGQETQYYGPATAGAVAAMQEAYASEILTPLGLTAGTGYFGASTRAKANELCADEDDMPDTPDLPDGDEDEDMDEDDEWGEEGSLDEISDTSADESNLEEGEEGGVYAFEVEIEGDIMIDRIDFYAELDDNTVSGGDASDDADDYFVRAFLMVDGEEVAELDVDDFDDDYTGEVAATTNDEEYRIRFSGLDLVYEDGDEPEFQLGFEMLGSLDSDDLAAEWAMIAESIRYKDGAGWNDTESLTTLSSDTFGFEAEEVAELSITEASSNPDSAVIKVDDGTDETDDVTVFVFEIEEENDVDVIIDDLRVTVTTSATQTDEDMVVASAALVYDGEELDSTSVPTGGVVDFENMDLEIEGDDTVTLEVQLTFEGNDGEKAYPNGNYVSVAFTSITDAEDANGYDEGEMDIDGSPSSETHQLQSEGVYAEIVSTDVDRTDGDGAADDQAEFEIKFDLTAFDGDFYVGSTSAAVVYHLDKDGISLSAADSIATSSAAISSTADVESNGNFKIVDDETETFTLTVSLDPDVDGFYRVVLDSVEYSASNSGTVDDESHTVSPASDFRTAQTSMDA